MTKFGWYFNRLRRMSASEVVYRIRSALVSALQEKGFLLADPVPAFSVRDVQPWVSSPGGGIDAQRYREAARRVIKGEINIFTITAGISGNRFHWNRDPLSGVEAPLSFGRKIDYRDKRKVGDIKYLWEPNRHLYLTVLAQAYHLTGDRSLLEGLRKILDSWFRQCPYPMGPNWTSSLELGIRLINWSLVWQWIGSARSPLFASNEGEAFRDRWLRSIYQHAHFISMNFSRYSSANNHLIGETAGLFIASVTWPFWPEMGKWGKEAFQILTEECLKQIGPDGVLREQAISYQQFVLDFLLLAALAGRRSRFEFAPEYWGRIERMMEFIASVMDRSGHLPMIGDADDGYVVQLSQEEDFCPYRSLLATGAVLFRRGDFKVKAGRLDDKTRWLLGEEVEERFREIGTAEARLPVRTAFPDGGYYILGSDFEMLEEVRLIVDGGPLGYLSIAAHGHADALSFTLFVGGLEFLVDPGTFAYHTQMKWRDYFRGTSAHNTLRVDKRDQSVRGGPFMWLRDIETEVVNVEKCGERLLSGIEALHKGYCRLKDPVLHKRKINYIPEEKCFVIVDDLNCRGSHLLESFFHMHPEVEVEGAGSRFYLNREDMSVVLEFDGAWNIKVFRGRNNPPMGWYSPSYNFKIPTTTICCTRTITGPFLSRTRMFIRNR